MKFRKLIILIKSDLYRYNSDGSFLTFIKTYFKIPGFNYSCKMRITSFLSDKKIFFPLFLIFYFIYKNAQYKFGISIPYKTKIGFGFYIGHFGGIVINSNVRIGNNVNLSHNVTIGKGGRRPYLNNGNPIICDEVYIGPGCVIVGDIKIGKKVAIGANSFVNKSFQENNTIAGNPAIIINQKGSLNLINNIWGGIYEK